MSLVERIAVEAPLFLLVFTRIFVLASVAPLLGSTTIPGIARVALTFFAAIFVFPMVAEAGYPIPRNALAYGLVMLGEGMIGITIGFILVVLFSVFQTAGQFFSLQIGFGASEVFDPLADVSIPLTGQFFNLMAMMIFVVIEGFQKIFLSGVYYSFRTLRAVDFVIYRNDMVSLVLSTLSGLFTQAMILALPILGTLFLASVTMGLLAKAAPQMNLLMLGFSLNIGVAYLIMFVSLPFVLEGFAAVIDGSFERLGILFNYIEEARGE
ncbi:MAG: flagellar biosynthetic protein FliR [Alkalispirochaetaceae bacterium]